jgi:hypothetical protein
MTTRAAPVSQTTTAVAPKPAPQRAVPQPLPLVHRLQHALGNQALGTLIQRSASGGT